MKILPIILLALLTLSCSSNYKFGDISTRYCNSATPEIRLTFKVLLNASGVVVGVDYCSAKGLVDVLAGVDNGS